MHNGYKDDSNFKYEDICFKRWVHASITEIWGEWKDGKALKVVKWSNK